MADFTKHEYHKHIGGTTAAGDPECCMHHNMAFALNPEAPPKPMDLVCPACQRPELVFATLAAAAEGLPYGTVEQATKKAEVVASVHRCARVAVRYFGYMMRREAQRKVLQQLEQPAAGVIHINYDFKKKMLAAMNEETMLDCALVGALWVLGV